MTRTIFRQVRLKLFLLFAGSLALSLAVTGCSSDSYDTPAAADSSPVAGAATSVLVQPASLKSWMDQGLLASDGSFDDKVVLLDIGPYTMTASDPDRIAGACRVAKGSLDSRRIEGVAEAYPLVATGAQMDAVIQSLGIDENTTIVLTTDPAMAGGAMFYATRAYWMFRYWGFPLERVKVLNGGNYAFAAAYPELMTQTAPQPLPSTYSVKDVEGDLNDDLRLSIGEMLTLVEDIDPATDVVLDARGANNYSGLASSPGYLTGKVDFVVYDGHPAGGQYLGQGELFNADKTFKTRTEIEALFAAKGWSKDKITTVYCLSGYSATPLFFAVEAILGAPARLYDGSWSQFGQYSDFTGALGQLPAGSPWAADQYLAVGEGYRYNFDYLNGAMVTTPRLIETLQLDAAAIAAQPSPFSGNVPADDSDAVPSQIEAADALYVGSTPTVTFPAPVETATAGVLIDETTLHAWMTAGLVNAPLGGERVVLLDAIDGLTYSHGHIPGAQLWDVAEHAAKRVEGPAPAVNMVLGGAAMDEMIQKHGIDENTTIVITSSQADTYYASRAYLLFRYYGFPRERLKVLNGYNSAWTVTPMTTIQPVVTPSTLSVADVGNIQLKIRASLAELMDAVRDGRGTPVDFRGSKSAAGSTAGVYSDVSGDYVVFEGILNGGKAFVWKNFNVDYAGGDLRFKDTATIEADLAAALGVADLNAFRVGDYSNPLYSYCRTGYIASTGFFVLDALLGVDVMAYDGSWSQWGKMSADATMGGELPAGSEWATDNATYMSVTTYNQGTTTSRPKTIEKLNPVELLLVLDPSDLEANQVENEDDAYKTPVSGGAATAAPTPFTPAGGGC